MIVADYDKDGDLDLFVGGRVKPQEYPRPPRSYILRNDNNGRFTDVTEQVCSDLVEPGMVTAALWTDYDKDGWNDLVLVGEWMPITFFRNQEGKSFDKQDIQSLESTAGWWNSLAQGDFDNDGDTDYVAGNLGKNSIYKASEEEPVCIYAYDFDNNGMLDPVLCRFIQGKEYPTHPRETLTEQIASLKRTLKHYHIYGRATVQSIFPELDESLIYKAEIFSSVFIENLGNNTFGLRELPVQSQMSPVFGISVTDVNADGNPDILLVGNSYATEPLTGFYDAGIGACLTGDGNGNFSSLHPTQSGFFVNGDAKSIGALKLQSGKTLYVVTQNQDSLKVFTRVNN